MTGLLLLAARLATADTATASVESVLAAVDAAEARMKDVRLDFRQTTLLKATGDAQDTRGELILARAPERFRVRFTAPVEQVAVYDGKALTLYLPEAGQAWRQRATAGDLSRLLGINPASPVASFRRGYRTALAGCDAGGCGLDFTKEGPTPLTWHVRVSASDWTMQEAWFENAEVRVTLACSGYRVNRGLPSRTFRLALPADVEVQDGMPQVFRGATP